MGVSGSDDWYFVAQKGDRILLWYNGYASVNGNYIGSVLMSKDQAAPISREESEYFEGMIKSLGKNKQDYCILDNSKCRNFGN